MLEGSLWIKAHNTRTRRAHVNGLKKIEILAQNWLVLIQQVILSIVQKCNRSDSSDLILHSKTWAKINRKFRFQMNLVLTIISTFLKTEQNPTLRINKTKMFTEQHFQTKQTKKQNITHSKQWRIDTLANLTFQIGILCITEIWIKAVFSWTTSTTFHAPHFG